MSRQGLICLARVDDSAEHQGAWNEVMRPRAAPPGVHRKGHGPLGQKRHHGGATAELPTILLSIGIYGAWAGLTFWHDSIPLYCLVPAGAWIIAWHSSLQHEIVHGHPTRWRGLNRMIGSIPLSLWLPFLSYKRSHLIHHRDERLTDPLDDPESNYCRPSDWELLPPTIRRLILVQRTLLGRLILSPIWTVAGFLQRQMQQILLGNRQVQKIWLGHLLHILPVLVWLTIICKMNLFFYFCVFVYPGTSLLLVRSFAEHRAAFGILERTAIVENAKILGPLFLFNNLHAVHHERPDIPWYQIPAWYRGNRDRLIAENGGLVYNTYFDIIRRYFLHPHAHPCHPFCRAPYADGHIPEEDARELLGTKAALRA
jgi:fatty acid desaturase